MKQVKQKIQIVSINLNQDEGPVTWGMLNKAIAGVTIYDTDIIDIGQDYSYWDGEKDEDGYSISITRNVYETEEEEAGRLFREKENQLAYHKMVAERALAEHQRAVAEHERLAALFNQIPKKDGGK